MIVKYINEVRLFQILFEDVNFYNDSVKQILINYISKYIQYKDMSAADLKINYENFLKQYSKDTKYFLRNNVYPAITDNYIYNIGREEYDIFLLLSTVLTQHRYDIMCEINQCAIKSESALIIGSGIGLEIEVIKKNYKDIDAYDIEIDDFCRNSHPQINFYEIEFEDNKNKYYNDIYIIELLEHVFNPYKLIKDVAKVLVNNDSRIILTLAVNIPQFDHIVNFDDIDLFLYNIDKLDLYVEYKKEIKHRYLMNGLSESSNVFMIIKQKI